MPLDRCRIAGKAMQLQALLDLRRVERDSAEWSPGGRAGFCYGRAGGVSPTGRSLLSPKG